MAYELNGLVYGLSVSTLKNNSKATSLLMGKVFPVITKHHVVDIDDELDWCVVENILGG